MYKKITCMLLTLLLIVSFSSTAYGNIDQGKIDKENNIEIRFNDIKVNYTDIADKLNDENNIELKTKITDLPPVKNNRDSEIKALTAMPDLTVSDLKAESEYPFEVYKSASFSFVFSNIGDMDASYFKYTITIGNILTATGELDSLSAGSSEKITIDLDNPNLIRPVPEGINITSVTIDSTNAISESDENNNSTSANFEWIGGQPNFTAISLTPVDQPPYEVNKEVKFDYKFKNSGTEAVDFFDIAVYVNSERLSGHTYSTQIKPYVTATIHFSMIIPNPGSYNIRVELDPDNIFAELKETDNSAETNIDIDAIKTYVWPTLSRRITQYFNPPDHLGIDIGPTTPGVPGDDIYAFANGTVKRSEVSQSYGEVVYLNSKIDGRWIQTRYAHMVSGSRKCSLGDSLSPGDIIGDMDNTGDSEGVHLHFETRTSDTEPDTSNSSIPIDPIANFFSGSEAVPLSRDLNNHEIDHNTEPGIFKNGQFYPYDYLKELSDEQLESIDITKQELIDLKESMDK